MSSVKQESGTSTTSGSRFFAMEDLCSILFITLSFSEVSNSALIFANACSSNSCFSLNVASNLASEEDVLTEGCLEAAFGVEVCASYMLWACVCYTQREVGVVWARVFGVHVLPDGSIDARVFAASQPRHPS